MFTPAFQSTVESPNWATSTTDDFNFFSVGTFYQSFRLCNSIRVQVQSCFWGSVLLSTGTQFKELRLDKLSLSAWAFWPNQDCGITSLTHRKKLSSPPLVWFPWPFDLFVNPPPRQDVGFTIYLIVGSFR